MSGIQAPSKSEGLIFYKSFVVSKRGHLVISTILTIV